MSLITVFPNNLTRSLKSAKFRGSKEIVSFLQNAFLSIPIDLSIFVQERSNFNVRQVQYRDKKRTLVGEVNIL